MVLSITTIEYQYYGSTNGLILSRPTRYSRLCRTFYCVNGTVACDIKITQIRFIIYIIFIDHVHRTQPDRVASYLFATAQNRTKPVGCYEIASPAGCLSAWQKKRIQIAQCEPGTSFPNIAYIIHIYFVDVIVVVAIMLLHFRCR